MSGSATAREFPEAEVERVRAAYDDDLRARWAIDEHASSVLAELAREDVLDHESASELQFAERSVKGLAKDGQAVAQIRAEVQTEDGHVEFLVRPQTGRVYANVFGETESYMVESPAGSDDVTTQECTTEHRCLGNYTCSQYACQYQERTCCDHIIPADVGTAECGSWTNDGCCPCPN